MWQKIKEFLLGSTVGPNNTKPITKPTNTKPTNTIMNEGDFHSGPHGYSPNTAYPETQYGSGFDEDADWNDGANSPVVDDEDEYFDEGDWR